MHTISRNWRDNVLGRQEVNEPPHKETKYEN